jgi:hypothetical protein
MTDTELARRLEKLERDNRRLKRSLLGVLVLLAALAGIYATRPVPEKITTHEFDMVDASGKVRVRIAMTCSLIRDKDCGPLSTGIIPTIHLYDPNGNLLTGISAGVLGIYGKQAGTVVSGDAVQISRGGATGGIASLGVGLANQGGSLVLEGNEADTFVAASGSTPMLEIHDSKGFSMALGSTNIVSPATGKTQQTSADSITMFGNDKEHRVIWKAP